MHPRALLLSLSLSLSVVLNLYVYIYVSPSLSTAIHCRFNLQLLILNKVCFADWNVEQVFFFTTVRCVTMTVVKKQGMYSLSCTTDLPPVCPKGTGSTMFPHKPLPKQIWRGSGTLSLLSGVTKFRKHQVYVCVCVFLVEYAGKQLYRTPHFWCGFVCVAAFVCCSVVLSLEMKSVLDCACAIAGDGPYLVDLPYCGALVSVVRLCYVWSHWTLPGSPTSKHTP